MRVAIRRELTFALYVPWLLVTELIRPSKF